MNAIGTLQKNGSRQIMRMVKPGPEDDTTSSMPNEPEHTSVKTTTTTVNSRMRTRLSAGSVKNEPVPAMPRTSDMRPPLLCSPGKAASRPQPAAAPNPLRPAIVTVYKVLWPTGRAQRHETSQKSSAIREEQGGSR